MKPTRRATALRKVSMAMGRRAVERVAAHAGRYLACFLCSARRAATLKPLGAPPALASRRRTSPAPTGSLLGSENVMSGPGGGVVSGGTCPVLERVL